MAEELKTETTQTEETKPGKVVFDSQGDFDAVIQRRISKEREKFSDHDTLKEELEKLRQEKNEREEAELTESEKLKKEIEDKDSEIAKLTVFKDKHEEWERQETEKIEAAMSELEDDDKDLINALPLDKRMSMINKLKPSNDSKPTPPSEKPFVLSGDKAPTTEEYNKIRNEYGPGSYEAVQAMALIRKHKGV